MSTHEQVWTEAQLRVELDRYEGQLRSAGKARNTITTYVQHPERFINWLVGRYKPKRATPVVGEDARPAASRTSSYEPLRSHLAGRNEPVLRATFLEIESILGRALPASARTYPAWWANEQAGTHVHARAWLGAGRRTRNVDLGSGTVEFVL